MPMEVREIIYFALYARNRWDLLRLAFTCSRRYDDIFNRIYPTYAINTGLDQQLFRLRIADRINWCTLEDEFRHSKAIPGREFFPAKDEAQDELVMLDWVCIGSDDKDRLVSIESLKGLGKIHIEIPDVCTLCDAGISAGALRNAMDLLCDRLSKLANTEGPVITMQIGNRAVDGWIAGCSLKKAVTKGEKVARESELVSVICDFMRYHLYGGQVYFRPENLCGSLKALSVSCLRQIL